jgi:hypothetical protein
MRLFRHVGASNTGGAANFRIRAGCLTLMRRDWPFFRGCQPPPIPEISSSPSYLIPHFMECKGKKSIIYHFLLPLTVFSYFYQADMLKKGLDNVWRVDYGGAL